ncbi:MAG TPA: hypothetical protein VHG93_26950 [Longimicrobium sp.]|nr:hypothetical protein [Longimicrobium sp.]
MACPTITLTGVTRDVWTCLRQRASGRGVTVPDADRGSIRHRDADADYAWDEGTAILTVTLTRSPSWIGCNAIESRIRQAAAGCGAS